MIAGGFDMPPPPGAPALYGLFRKALRLWFGLLFRRIRVLQPEALSRSGPALLVVNHPPSLADAFILIAGLDRQVHCLLDHEFLRSAIRKLCGRLLGMIPHEVQGDDWPAALETCCRIFSRGGIVVLFARHQAAGSEEPAGFAPQAAEVAIEARLATELLLPIHAVHLFLPVSPSRSNELMILIDAPLSSPHKLSMKESDLDDSLKSLDAELERACRQNPFRLPPGSLEEFLTGLEGVMREDFAERWSRRANWKQKVEDFELSPFLVKLMNELNYGHPGRLVALREALQAYHEAKRQSALRLFRAETAGEWFGSEWRRSAAWLETLAGLPIACYGLVNLLVAWLVLRISGMLRKGLWQATPREWAARAVIVLICYAGQIALLAQFLPRSEAGFYAPSLPLSGGYFLRYLWLLEHRTIILTQTAGRQRRMDALRRMRRKLIEELKRDQDRFAALWKIAH